jgi:putative ABC transport system permease protein
LLRRCDRIALAPALLKIFVGLAPVDISRLAHVQVDGIVLAFAFVV